MKEAKGQFSERIPAGKRGGKTAKVKKKKRERMTQSEKGGGGKNHACAIRTCVSEQNAGTCAGKGKKYKGRCRKKDREGLEKRKNH